MHYQVKSVGRHEVQNGSYAFRSAWMLYAYPGSGTASVIESVQTWATKEEAQAAADRANAGDETGLSFGLYSDD